MAWALRAGSYANNGAGNASVANGATTTIAMGGAISAGDLIVLAILSATSGPAPATFSVSDSVNGTTGWTEIKTGTYTPFAVQTRLSLWATPNSGAGTPTATITMNGTGANTYTAGLMLVAFSGLATSSPVDTSPSFTNGTAGTLSTGAVSPATGAANELFVAFNADIGDNTTLASGLINGASATLTGKHDNDAGTWQGIMEHADSGSSGGTPSATVTSTGSSVWGMLGAIFKLSGAASTIPPGLGPVVGMPEWSHFDTAMTR